MPAHDNLYFEVTTISTLLFTILCISKIKLGSLGVYSSACIYWAILLTRVFASFPSASSLLFSSFWCKHVPDSFCRFALTHFSEEFGLCYHNPISRLLHVLYMGVAENRDLGSTENMWEQTPLYIKYGKQWHCP